uniref:Ionotropic glutamate receptor C-terminal domain-containing protein n=1 Tax=Ditylum brightwellii TaxID=49249 RepID=A0A7S4RFW6_9STRA
MTKSFHLWFLLALSSEGKYYNPPTQQHHRSLIQDAVEISNDSLPPKKPNGDDRCPCLSFDTLQDDNSLPLEPYTDFSHLGPNTNVSMYGVGCEAHDEITPACSDDQCSTQVPLPDDCDKFWCARSWCFVDPSNCKLLHTPSIHFTDRHFSYATCGQIDSFTLSERKKAIKDKTYQVALNSNSGGWRGSYNPEGSFAVNNRWSGPIVDFLRTSALEGGFTMNITRPPEWIREDAKKFFGSSSFDYCVYAVSLGYLDFCLAAYTITNKRAAVANFFETTNNGVYLISFVDVGGTSWSSFIRSAKTIFQPFTWGAWAMIFFFVIPILSLLMLMHEHGAPGSAYPLTAPALVVGQRAKLHKVAQKHVPVTSHVLTSLYMGILSFFQQSYDQSVVTVGGKINLLAISSFVLLVLAVYTANLAAILTQDAQNMPVSDIAGVIKAGYRICAERKVAELIMSLYDIDPNRFVPDPIELGGDGGPGFNCPNCAARSRVFDFMKLDNSDPSLYCDIGIASEEDLEVLHGSTQHCNKTQIGKALGYESIGIPIFSGVSPELISFFHEMKNEGVLNRVSSESFPDNSCPETGGEGSSLNVEQMTGIWIIVFGFALVGVWARLYRKHITPVWKETKRRERWLERYDQWGNPTAHNIFIDGHKYEPDHGDSGKLKSKRSLMVSDLDLNPGSEEIGKRDEAFETINGDEFHDDKTTSSEKQVSFYITSRKLIGGEMPGI